MLLPSIRHAAVLVITPLLLSACGGGSPAGASAGAGSNGAGTAETGSLIDSPVAGIGYRTATQSGVTDASGHYRYLPGETVTFFVGAVTLPPVPATGTVTPFDLAGTSDTGNQIALNIATFLQSLDSDANPSNGISIPEQAAALAVGGIDFNVSTTHFAQNVNLRNLVRDANPGGRVPVDVGAARDHLLSTVRNLPATNKVALAPISHATATPQTAVVGQTIVFSSEGSEDLNGDLLRFAWGIASKPGASQATLSSATAAQTMLTPDVAGTYTVGLAVSDESLHGTEFLLSVVVSDPPPPSVTVTGLSIGQAPSKIALGSSLGLVATASYSNGSTGDVSAQASWSSDTPAVLGVGAGTGLLTANSVGSAQITASFDGAAASPVSIQVVELAAPIAHRPVSVADSGGGDGTVTLRWNEVADASSYNVYWLPDGVGVTTAANRIEGVQSGHVQSGLSGGDYSYRVAAVLGNTEVLSEEVFTTVFTAGQSVGAFSTVSASINLGFDVSLTRLVNGKVLIAGNEVPGSSSPLLFDPDANSTSPIALGALKIGTKNATARLADGKLLITGGRYRASMGAAPVTVADTYLFDPATSSITAGAQMPAIAAGHTATTLFDGRVLIAGGGGSQTATFLYDPVAGSFSTGPTLSSARSGHLAVRLHDGRVLLVGGNAGGTSELFDPATNSISAAGNLALNGIYLNGALLTDGRVLVIASGDVGSPATAVQFYDPQSGNFSAGGALHTPRIAPAIAVLANGNVLIAGGNDGSFVTTNAEIYDVASHQSTATGSMTLSDTFLDAVPLRDGRVLVSNGWWLITYQP
ncbi:MAG: hypothetical protein R3E83_21145 [Burkholderiaceae bacterium]